MRPHLAAAALLTLAALGPGAAYAHDDTWLDAQHAPNGGQLRMAGPYHYELVVARDATAAKDSPLVVHVTDHAGAPVPTAGAAGSAIVQAGREKANITLQPDGANRMRGRGRYTAAAGMKVVVSITLAGARAQQARFTPAEGRPAHAGHGAVSRESGAAR